MIWGVPLFLETARWKRCRFFTHQKMQLHHWSFTAPWKMVLGRQSLPIGLSVTFQGAMMNKPGYQKISWQKWYKLWSRPRPTHPPPMKIVTIRHLWRPTNLHFKLPKMRQVLCLGDLLERGCGGNAVATTKNSIKRKLESIDIDTICLFKLWCP